MFSMKRFVITFISCLALLGMALALMFANAELDTAEAVQPVARAAPQETLPTTADWQNKMIQEYAAAHYSPWDVKTKAFWDIFPSGESVPKFEHRREMLMRQAHGWTRGLDVIDVEQRWDIVVVRVDKEPHEETYQELFIVTVRYLEKGVK